MLVARWATVHAGILHMKHGDCCISMFSRSSGGSTVRNEVSVLSADVAVRNQWILGDAKQPDVF